MTNIVTLASGQGTNFKAILDAISAGEIPGARPTALITDRGDSGAARIAHKRSIKVIEIDFMSFNDRTVFDQELLQQTLAQKPDLILTLGYMRLLSSDFINSFTNRIINVHPSLLPAFPGVGAQRQALDYGVKVSGATVHYVDNGIDTGAIIAQAPVTIPDGVELEELKALIRIEEHRLIVEACRLHCQGALTVDGRQVRTTKNKKV